MAASLPTSCPACGYTLQSNLQRELGVIRCPACGDRLPSPWLEGIQENDAKRMHAADSLEDRQAIERPIMSQWDEEPDQERESFPSELKIKLRGPGESLAVLALIIPLVVLYILLLGNIQTLTATYVIGFGAVFLTALLMTIDAASMGNVDLYGNRRVGAGTLFLGMILLWIVFYPIAFFRRRHFGRSNFGFMALVVAGIFVGGPFLADILFREGLLDDKPPACSSPEVVDRVDLIIRQGAGGFRVRSIRGHREIQYKSITRTRIGECVVETDAERIPITYSVTWLDRGTRLFHVQIHK